ncbi:MAG: hypothetical protein QXZ20_03700, partial [Candidatus Aenigmatarchaeota archaeon]
SREELLKILDPLVEKALKGYNLEDPVMFFENFAESMRPTTTPQYFKAVYLQYKKEFGKFISKTLIKDKSSFDLYYPVLVYRGNFENNKKIIIKVNFMNEYGFYRITQIEFDKVYD